MFLQKAKQGRAFGQSTETVAQSAFDIHPSIAIAVLDEPRASARPITVESMEPISPGQDLFPCQLGQSLDVPYSPMNAQELGE
jgi:hypothetical protein